MSFQSKQFFNLKYDLVEAKAKKNYKGFLNLSSNELHHAGIKEVCDNFFLQSLTDKVRCYPYYPDSCHQIATHFAVADDQVVLASGSDFAINLLLMVLKNKKSVVICNPEYYSYSNYAIINGFEIIKPDNFIGGGIDKFKEYINLLNSIEPSIVVLSNPNGLTGYKLDVQDMHEIAAFCHRKGHLLIIDEAYSLFCELAHTHLINQFNNVIVLKTFSKTHGMAGLRFAALFSSKEIITYLRKTGIENTVSGVTADFFLYLIERKEFITKVIHDVNTVKQRFSEMILTVFPNWHIFETATHFVTIDTFDKQCAKTVTEFFEKNKIIIKNLGSVCDLATCIRITVPEKNDIEKVVSLLNQYKTY